jgi:hypothetical protein
LEDGTLTDVVLLVEGERLPTHRVILTARSVYFYGLFQSGMQGGTSEGGVQEIEQVSAGAFRMVLWYLYTAEMTESGREGLVQEGEDNIFHIPFVTGNIFNVYNNKYTFDGGFSSFPYLHSSKDNQIFHIHR